MQRYSRVLAFLLIFLMIFSFCGCGQKSESPLSGKWAYIHDTEKTIISIGNNGKAEYEGEKYKFTSDDNFIYLLKDNKESKFRYELNKDGFLFYISTDYEYKGEGTPEGIIGEWVNRNNKWYYEFTEEGTFNEDGFFQGHYTIDTDNSRIKLAYNDHFVDTYIYYSLNGNTLTIEYPWQMVEAE